MPKFIDTHKMNPLTEKQLKQAQSAAKDEFGVTHENIIYGETENKVFCMLDAPNKEAVEKTPPKNRHKARLHTRSQDDKVTNRLYFLLVFFIQLSAERSRPIGP